jgi:branched-subunit amino acid transport protein
MSDLVLVLAVATVTFASRASFVLRGGDRAGQAAAPFLEVFPLALFVALATVGLVAPEGRPALTPSLAAALGGVAGAMAFRRSIVAVVVLGAVAYWAARLLLA